MFINSLYNINLNMTNNSQKVSKSIPTFKTYNSSRAKIIEQQLAKKGITCNTNGYDFMAECFQKTVEIFEKLFGRSYLPEKLTYDTIAPGVYGQFEKYANEVTMNYEYEYGCFWDMDSLKKEAEKNYNSILPSWNSTKHPAHTFVHEFSHAAHWQHLKQRNGFSNAVYVMEGLHYTQVPTAIGRLITRFKLSDYAVDGNMKEFMAERMTKDICNGLTDNMWLLYKDVDVNYHNIFNRNWDYRYSSPQSYIDYFTEQVWNGDIQEAINAGYLAENYLKDLDVKTKTAPLITKAAEVLNYIPKNCTESNKPLLFHLGSLISKGLTGINKAITKKLDDKNKIKITFK